MTTEFNAYHTWLGIPLKDQPPHHYRLLGLELFESSPDVIEHAADRQRAHLKGLNASKHAATAQRILNELSAAKVCLLNADKKTAYDRQLKARLEKERAAEAAKQRPLPVAQALAPPAPQAPPPTPFEWESPTFSTSRPRTNPTRKRAQRPAWVVPTIGVSAAVLALILAVVFWPKGDVDTQPVAGASDTDGAKGNDKSKSVKAPAVVPPTSDDPPRAVPTTPDRVQDTPSNNPAPAAPVVGIADPPAVPATPSPPRPRQLSIGRYLAKGNFYWNGDGEASVYVNGAEVGKGTSSLGKSRDADLREGDVVAVRLINKGWRYFTMAFVSTDQTAAIPLKRADDWADVKSADLAKLTREAVWAATKRPVVAKGNSLWRNHRLPTTLEQNREFYWGAGEEGMEGNECQFAFVVQRDQLVPLVKSIDLLKTISLSRDVVAGAWRLDEQGLFAPPDKGKLHIPLLLPQEYKLTMMVERKSGDEWMYVGLFFGDTPAAVVFDAYHGNVTGLDGADRKGYVNNSTTRRGPQLVGKIPATMVYTVRQKGISMTCDGETIFDWTGDAQSLSKNDSWNPPNKRYVFLGTYNCSFQISQLLLTPLGVGDNSTSPVGPPTAIPSANEIASRGPRLPVPEAGPRQESEKLAREVFAKEFAAAKKPAEKSDLAFTLLKQAGDSTDDPVGRYALLSLAREVAIAASDVALTVEVLDRISELYEVDRISDFTAELGKLSASTILVATQQAVAGAAFALAESAAAADDYDGALKLARLALTAAQKSRDVKLIKQVTDRGKELTTQQKAFEEVAAARKKLQTESDDAAANLAVGRWFIAVKNDATTAMPYLAKVADAALKDAATKDLTMLVEAPAQSELADAWWDLAQATKDDALKNAFLTRAFQWYSTAAPNLAGLSKAKAEKRIEESRTLSEKAIAASRTAPTFTGGPSRREPGLTAEYFKGSNFEMPLTTRIDTVVSLAFAESKDSGVPVTNFSIRWNGFLKVPKSGTYHLRHGSDDGSRIYLDNQLLFDCWKGGRKLNENTQAKTIDLKAGTYPLKIEYFQVGGPRGILLNWTPPGAATEEPIGPQYFFHDAAKGTPPGPPQPKPAVRLGTP